MTSDERNFRSIYYEKVGCKSVEEKKSLENLLKEKCVDAAKLKHFCLRFAVPHVHRSLLWKLLLGVIPMQVDCRNFVMSQRKQEYNDLHHTLLVLRLADEKTPKYQRYHLMWLIQTGNLTFELNLAYERDPSFLAIVKCLMHFFDDDIDIYWTARKMYENVGKMKSEIPKLIEVTHNLLEKEDIQLFKVLQSNSVLDNLPLDKWFDCCFAGVIHDNCLIKIWDKICGGSFKILAYLLTAILITLKTRIMKLNDPVKITEYIKTIPEETADIILNKTIDMWQVHINPLTVHDKENKVLKTSFV